ncbi:MAG: YbjQ family protein [Victivallales bacterium]|nr:YbjQ family protein [Victivallales bacterium]
MDAQTSPEPTGGLLICFYIAFPLLLLVGTWLIHWLGGRSRRRHLDEQEAYFHERIRVTNLKRFPPSGCLNPQLVTGSAAIANNYFVAFLAGFKHIFGGELKGYTQMCDEARRLALVRLLQEAESIGANAVYNVRFETATIVTAQNNKQSGGVELIAYGTAVHEER